jgi:hypothetical protein
MTKRKVAEKKTEHFARAEKTLHPRKAHADDEESLPGPFATAYAIRASKETT